MISIRPLRYVSGSGRIENLSSQEMFSPVSSSKSQVTSMDTQLEAEPSSRKNLVWTQEMDSCMVGAFIQEMHKGNKIDRSFTNAAYQAVCDELFVKCGVRLAVVNVKNRLKTLKKDLGAFQDIQQSGSGFAFNRNTGMMDAEPKCWDEYVKAHPESRPYRHKAVPCFESLQLVFGQDRATGLAMEITRERNMRLESSNGEPEGQEQVEPEADRESIGPSDAAQDSNTSYKKTSKRKRGVASNLAEDFLVLKDGMESAAKAIDYCGPYSGDELYDEIMKVDGLDEESQFFALCRLCGDVPRAFVAVPVARRKKFLETIYGALDGTRSSGSRHPWARD